MSILLELLKPVENLWMLKKIVEKSDDSRTQKSIGRITVWLAFWKTEISRRTAKELVDSASLSFFTEGGSWCGWPPKSRSRIDHGGQQEVA